MTAASKGSGQHLTGMLQSISIVIPTYEREQILVDSISALLDLEHPADEILVVDQTEEHEQDTIRRLQQWDSAGRIRWIQREKPSITEAMNHGLQAAKNPLVLFLDDDIRPHPGLVLNHAAAHAESDDLWATVGQVIQPWQAADDLDPPRKLKGLKTDFDFPFHSTRDATVENVMAGNLCVNREKALKLGGFDENFIVPAYRFETDFARRVIKSGGKIRFVAAAGIDHLRVKSGGTRIHGSHLTSASALHGFGDYYFAFKHGQGGDAWRYAIHRFFREVRTRFHFMHPWWIPVKMFGEARAILMARRSLKSGQKFIGQVNKE